MGTLAYSLDESSVDAAPSLTASLQSLFDAVAALFKRSGTSYRAMTELVEGLHGVHSSQRGSEWVAVARRLARQHPVRDFILQCPFTAHSAEKPRGYAGDPELIDFIYRHDGQALRCSGATEIGRILLQHNTDSPCAAAVRNRRHLCASYIAELVQRKPGARILCIASGHARELELLSPQECAGIGRFVLYDHDGDSLEVCSRYASRGVRLEPVHGTIVQLLRDETLTGFDFIYSPGLFDYLSDRLAQRITTSLFRRLNPEGRLLLANFLPRVRDAGYMEVFMEWSLIYRNEAQIRGFSGGIPDDAAVIKAYFMEPHRNIGFLEVTRLRH